MWLKFNKIKHSKYIQILLNKSDYYMWIYLGWFYKIKWIKISL